MTTTDIALDGITKSFGRTEIIPPLTTAIRGGEFTVILGPSGCGKSTLLNLIAGLEPVSGGTIRFGQREVQDVPAKDRGCAMVFQNYALYPHMSVAGNIGYALKLRGLKKARRMERIRAVAAVTDLSDYLDRRPDQLSGGQRQRVAIARAIVREPDVLLFDEPLSNLDAKLRHDMRMELSSLHKRLDALSIFVTHDQVEAMTLADRIVILNKGRIEQFGPPDEIYHAPASTFVAGFIGSPPMNLIEVTGDGGHLRLEDGTVLAQSPHQGPATCGIRPERVGIAETGIVARIIYREDFGSHGVLVVHLSTGAELRIQTWPGTTIPADGLVQLVFPTDALYLFDRESGLALHKERP